MKIVLGITVDLLHPILEDDEVGHILEIEEGITVRDIAEVVIIDLDLDLSHNHVLLKKEGREGEKRRRKRKRRPKIAKMKMKN